MKKNYRYIIWTEINVKYRRSTQKYICPDYDVKTETTIVYSLFIVNFF